MCVYVCMCVCVCVCVCVLGWICQITLNFLQSSRLKIIYCCIEKSVRMITFSEPISSPRNDEQSDVKITTAFNILDGVWVGHFRRYNLRMTNQSSSLLKQDWISVEMTSIFAIGFEKSFNQKRTKEVFPSWVGVLRTRETDTFSGFKRLEAPFFGERASSTEI